ncbi:hypothetical protein GCM10010407_03580 [Rarobacter incanus]
MEKDLHNDLPALRIERDEHPVIGRFVPLRDHPGQHQQGLVDQNGCVMSQDATDPLFKLSRFAHLSRSRRTARQQAKRAWDGRGWGCDPRLVIIAW